jgi:glycosyltransferase involved in cell wall biosynthesis
VLKEYMQRAKAFVFAAQEDFGIMPVEAQACGTPVIAYGSGGTLETVRGLGESSPTGVFLNNRRPNRSFKPSRPLKRTRRIFNRTLVD